MQTPEREIAERTRLAAQVQKRAQRIRAVAGDAPDRDATALWTGEDILNALPRLARILGHTPSITELQACSRKQWPSPACVRVAFGSWNAALAAAGLPLNRIDARARQRWSDEAILGAIREAAAAGDPGQKPFREGRRHPSVATIATRFGSWSVAESIALGGETRERSLA